jgi:hypothetical protein
MNNRDATPNIRPRTPMAEIVFLHPTVAISIMLNAVSPPPTNGAVVSTELASGFSLSSN